KGHKVILVDADLRNPSTAKVLGMKEQSIGTLEVIKGEASIEEAVQPYKDTGVMILAGSNPIQDTSSVLSGENMRHFIKELEKQADFVIIDTPPSALLSDAAIVAQYVDGAVFVVRQDYTDVDQILDGMEILSGSGVTINGCILNDVNTGTAQSSHYGHGYHAKADAI
ncbi:tyrosine-protein kinase family protein, partial [Anaerostipes sp.]